MPPHLQRAAAAAQLVQFAAGRPQRTMLLAHHLFDRLDEPAAGEDAARDALDTALRGLDDPHISLWTGLGRSERAAVVAPAGGLSPTSRAAAQDHGTARSSMQRAVERLEADGQPVLRHEARLALLDPRFAEWLRRR